MVTIKFIELFYLLIAILSLIFALIGVILSISVAIRVKAMEKSSHTVQFMPTEDAIREWGTSDKEVEKINNVNKDDLSFDIESLSI